MNHRTTHRLAAALRDLAFRCSVPVAAHLLVQAEMVLCGRAEDVLRFLSARTGPEFIRASELVAAALLSHASTYLDVEIVKALLGGRIADARIRTLVERRLGELMRLAA